MHGVSACQSSDANVVHRRNYSSRRLDADVVVVVVVDADADAGTDVLSILMTIDKIRSTSLRAREKQTGIRDAR